MPRPEVAKNGEVFSLCRGCGTMEGGRFTCSPRTWELSPHVALKSIRSNRVFRTLIVALTFAGWIVLSNHCALGRVVQTAQAQKEHACCHNGDSQPARQPANGGQGVQCCKSLCVIMPDGAKSFDPPPPAFVLAILAALLTRESRTDDPVVLASDTGPPPRAASFSELVLHRSLRSHAPPFLP